MSTELLTPTEPAAVAATPVAPEPAAYVPRFTTEDKATLMGSGNPEALRTFAKGLTEDELAILEDPSKGLDYLFNPAASQQQSDPAAAAVPVAAPAVTPEPTPSGETGEPATGEPTWLMTDEEFAAASPKIQAMYSELAQTLEKLESVQEPEPDPYAQDPVIAWRRQALETGKIDLPDVDVSDLVAMSGGKIDDIWMALDKAHVDQDPKAWETAFKTLVGKVVEETKARTAIKAQASVEEAYTAGKTLAETRYELMDFIRDVPEFKTNSEPLFIRNADGTPGLNTKNPAAKFVEYFKSKAPVFDPILTAEGPRTAIELAWTAFSKDQAGGYKPMMAKLKESAMTSVLQRMKSTTSKHFSANAAPSVGTVRAPVSSAPIAMYHGVDLNSLKTRADVDRVIQGWRATNNTQAIAGFEAAIAGARK